MIINTLKELRQQINQISPNDLLKYSSIFDCLECAKIAIKRGADIKNNSVINIFAFNNNLKAVKFFIDNGADIHIENNQSLNYAIMNKNVEMVEYLMNLGATTEDPFFKIRLEILLNK